MQVFISYKRQEETFARRLWEKLQEWEYSVWLDVEDISPGVNWDDSIHKGLKTSDVIVGVVTPEAVDPEIGKKVQDEWSWAQDHKRQLLLLSLHENVDIPPRYARIQRIDFTENEAYGLEKLKSTLVTLNKIINDHMLQAKREGFSQHKEDVTASIGTTDSSHSRKPSQGSTSFSFARAILLGNDKVPRSQLLIHQNIFYCLGIQSATDKEKNVFLDELEIIILVDFVENGVESIEQLLDEDEFTQYKTILGNIDFLNLEKTEPLIDFLEKNIPDFEKIILVKTLELKKGILLERINQMAYNFASELDNVEQIMKAQSLADQDRWKDAWNLLNSITHS